jgi:GntR family transcriptional regulator
MNTIDREAATSVRAQLVEQLRYLIASGHFAVRDTLPSTRTLGKQVGVSFHTARKAYQALEAEGLVEARAGSGYVVKERTPLSKSERLERGAAVVHDALQRLIGFGLTDAEIERLFQEQAGLLDHAGFERKLLVAGPHPELNALCAAQLADALQRPVQTCTLGALARHADADFVFAAYPDLQAAMQAAPRADVLGFGTHLAADVLARVARLRPSDTLGLVTEARDTIRPLTDQLRAQTAFQGQFLAAALADDADHLDSFLDQTDGVLYTPACHRALRPLLPAEGVHLRLTPVVSADALHAIRAAVPS